MRIRTIKPQFWASEDIVRLSDKAKLLAIGLLNYADDEGYFKANYRIIQSHIFPYEPALDIHTILDELLLAGYITISEQSLSPHGGLTEDSVNRRVGHIVGFTTHQRVNRPTPSILKDSYHEGQLLKTLSSSSIDLFKTDSMRAHGGLTEDSLPEGKGKERNKEGKGSAREVNSNIDLPPKISPTFGRGYSSSMIPFIKECASKVGVITSDKRWELEWERATAEILEALVKHGAGDKVVPMFKDAVKGFFNDPWRKEGMRYSGLFFAKDWQRYIKSAKQTEKPPIIICIDNHSKIFDTEDEKDIWLSEHPNLNETTPGMFESPGFRR